MPNESRKPSSYMTFGEVCDRSTIAQSVLCMVARSCSARSVVKSWFSKVACSRRPAPTPTNDSSVAASPAKMVAR